MRLQKFLAEAGVASRRASEQLIATGRIEVNGRTMSEMGLQVDPEQDVVKMDGRRIEPKRKLYVALNKPRGYLSTRLDPLGRRTLFDLLPAEWSHLFPVGRLDNDSEGLIFLTNDGDFCLHVTHPRYGVLKRYLACVEGEVTLEMLARLTHGVSVEGTIMRAHKARFLERSSKRSVLEIELAEGKNREVRRMLAALGIEVVHLQRVQIGPLKLGELPVGKWRTLTKPEIISLLPKL